MKNLAIFTDANPEYLENEERMQTKTEVRQNFSEIIKKAHEDQKEIGCCEKIKDYEVRQSFFDFRELKF